MPEEVNRIVTDVLSTLLLCPTRTAVDNLAREGITRGVRQVGDVMLDMVRRARTRAGETRACQKLGLDPDNFYLVTVHRAENTDHPERLRAILSSIDALGAPTIFPVHPRTRQALASVNWRARGTDLRLIEPLGYLEMIELVANARTVLTDSGGVQKEAFFLGRPCVTLREETEWLETLEDGWNVLAGTSPERIAAAVARRPVGVRPPHAFGDGRTAELIAAELARGPAEAARG
jgi:UDP-N-acetylglucosamine 2-epimerase